MFLAKQPIIKCPHCGYEYLPAEIVFPNSLLGRPVNTVRDALGKILYTDYQEGHDPETTESYICDGCNKQFIVKIDLSYKVSEEEPELDFSNQSVSLLD